MDDAFFGLKRRPFSPLPDPAFFYLGRAQQEAIRLIESGLQIPGGGWILITGESGLGKTILGRYLLGRLRSWARGLISFAQPAPEPILLGVRAKAGPRAVSADPMLNRQDLLRALAAEAERGRPALLIVDAAHRLTPESLSALMGVEARGVRLLLLAEPQVRELIAQCEPQGFVGRLAAFYQLTPFSADEICPYIQHRLQLAGASDPIFDAEACAAIFEQTQGVPRLINRVCELALSLAEFQGSRSVGRHLIASVTQVDGGYTTKGAISDPYPQAPGQGSKAAIEFAPQQGFTPNIPPPGGTSRGQSPIRTPGRSPASGLPPGLKLIDGDRAPPTYKPPPSIGRQRGYRRAGTSTAWQGAAFILGSLILGGLLGWFFGQEMTRGQGGRGGATPARLDPQLAAEGSAGQTDQKAQPTELGRPSAQPPVDELARPPQGEKPPEDHGSTLQVSEPRLERLVGQLNALGIPSEWRAPNHLRADLSQRIQFREGSRALDESARAFLARFAALLKDEPGIRIHITTHTDTRGGRLNNKLLSERRAADIALVLRLNGIAKGRITYEGKGASEPKFSPEEEKRLGPWVNRRVEIDLIAEGERLH